VNHLLDSLAERLTEGGLRPKRQCSMARRGYWRIGGAADLYVEVPDAEHLSLIIETGLPVSILGNGTNLLVADEGIRGVVVKLAGSFRQYTVEHTPDGPVLTSGAGIYDAVLLRRLAADGLAGLGCLAGVPGTLGGAIRMNAGTYLGEIGDRVIDIDVVLPTGQRRRIAKSELQFAYRRAHLPQGAIITEVRLQLEDDPSVVEEQLAAQRHHLARRQRTQPLDQPSCGSVFKNPPGDAAGRLIDQSGLKGTVRGGAAISETHANFIVNQGGATARDVHDLVVLARQTVFDRTGIVLEPEVHAVGDWPDGGWTLPPPA
jgi:UDP-N-acetylmuramate dehydrogenase